MVYFLNWSQAIVASTTGQIDKPAVYDQNLGGIILHGKGEYSNMTEKHEARTKAVYDEISKGTKDITALIISSRSNAKTAKRMLKKVREEVAAKDGRGKKSIYV